MFESKKSGSRIPVRALSAFTGVSGKGIGLLGAAVVLALSIGASNSAAEGVTIRLASDTGTLPHPAAIAQEVFKERVEKEIPGSKVRIFTSSSLYKNPEAIEAMTEGNLEMAMGQFGKSAQADPYMNLVVGPMLLTTVGAANELDNFETFKMLRKHFNDVHDIKLFGSAHLSFYMGLAADSRLLVPDDFKGRKMRSNTPAANGVLSALGANPTVMAFGDVPVALQTGVIDGMLTSLGAWNAVKEQVPYYTIVGVNGVFGDFYYLAASNKWWNKLSAKNQQIIEKIIIDEVLPLEKRANYCNDMRLIDKYGTKDPAKPGIYITNDTEAEKLSNAIGDTATVWIKANTPDAANVWVDKFVMEAKAAVARNPAGSNWLEKTDCKALEPIWAKYKK